MADFYSSVYANSTDKDRIKEGKPAQKGDFNAHKGHLTLGFNKTMMKSESQGSFVEAKGQLSGKKERDELGRKIKAHNFELNYNKN